MSDTLVWHLIRDNNSFLHKVGRTSRAGAVQFSAEKGNLLNVNTFKYSGLANSKAIDISTATSEKGKHRVVLTTKNAKKSSKPAKAARTTLLLSHKAKALKVLAATATSKFYRRDLASAAAARFTKLKNVVKIRSGLAKKAKTQTHRK